MARSMRCAALLPVLLSAVLAQQQLPDLVFNSSAPLDTVSSQLFGLDLEFTRHDLFAGLSAQLLANRLFTVQPAGESWPSPVNWGSAWPPRWTALPGPGGVNCTVCQHALPPIPPSQCMRCPDGSGLAQATTLGGFGSSAGAFGSALGFQQGVSYTLVVVARLYTEELPVPQCSLLVNISGVVGTQMPFSSTSNAWQRLETTFTSPLSTPGATLSLTPTCSGPRGTMVEFNATSLMPSDHFLGMRRDVVAALAGLNFSGPLRYPGGCFAPFYRWKDGLLPRETRPVVQTPAGYCDAVPGGVNSYTDGMMENGISTDEYLQLCAAIGATPAITIALQYGTPAEIQDAVDWLEYTNGNASTQWGGLRVQRAREQGLTVAPASVPIWYLGNEISSQARWPNYPEEPNNKEGPPSAASYADMLRALVPAFLAVDPSVQLSAVEGGEGWNGQWAAAVGPHISFTSFHGGYASAPLATPSDFTAAAKIADAAFLPALSQLRQSLTQQGVGHVGISADEWGLGPPWDVGVFNTAHALYGATLLSLVIGSAAAEGIAFTNYFEPVNEGAIAVGQFSCALTPLGQMLPLFSLHAGGARVGNATAAPCAGCDVISSATWHVPRSGRGHLQLTLVNRNAVAAFVQPVLLLGAMAADAVTLAATGPTLNSTFVSSSASLPLQGSRVLVPLPPYSIVSVKVA